MVSTIISYLAVLGFGGIVGVVLKHFLDRSREKKLNAFGMKREAYIKAIAEISGLADKTFLDLISNYQITHFFSSFWINRKIFITKKDYFGRYLGYFFYHRFDVAS